MTKEQIRVIQILASSNYGTCTKNTKCMDQYDMVLGISAMNI